MQLVINLKFFIKKKIIYKSVLKPIGNYEKVNCVQKVGSKIEDKTPTIDRIAQLYGWLKEQLIFFLFKLLKKEINSILFNSRQIGIYSTQRAYILKKELADLETALVRYTLDFLDKKVTLTF